MPEFKDYVLVPRRVPAADLRNGDILEVGRTVVTGVRKTADAVAYRVKHRLVTADPRDELRILVPEIR